MVAALKFATPFIEKSEAGDEVPIPMLPFMSINSVLVATPVDDEAMRKEGIVGERL